MPTNEQIIEAARRRMAQGDVLRIETELTSGYSTYKYTVVFSDRGHWTVTPEEAEAVALEPKQEDVGHCDYPCDADKGYNLICNACTKGVSLIVKEPKQEHDHNSHDCNGCANIERQAWNRAIKFNEAGKALLSNHDHDTEACVLCEEMYYKRKPLDRDALRKFLRERPSLSGFECGNDLPDYISDNFSATQCEHKPFDVDAVAFIIDDSIENLWDPRDTAKKIAEQFAMPERKPICETQVRAAIQEAMLNYLPGDVRNVTKALNEFLDLQPAPVEAEREVWKPTDKQSERILSLLERAPEGVDRIALLIDAIQQMQGKFHRERGTV